ncbi:hypothetical protein BD289DRAFT_251824 [Coniella lustricola]|uniref:Transmembrane protein n=1 Tax=Coniella lustricola TaxID=2025994 RepID=A0A2T3A8L2_9PEZI|nr:hypothetical protein BD289DRAFT_251824 [Coniella lustricola]
MQDACATSKCTLRCSNIGHYFIGFTFCGGMFQGRIWIALHLRDWVRFGVTIIASFELFRLFSYRHLHNHSNTAVVHMTCTQMYQEKQKRNDSKGFSVKKQNVKKEKNMQHRVFANGHPLNY